MKLTLIVALFSVMTLNAAERRGPTDPSTPSMIVGGNDVGPQYPFVGQIFIRNPENDRWYACTDL